MRHIGGYVGLRVHILASVPWIGAEGYTGNKEPRYGQSRHVEIITQGAEAIDAWGE